MINFLTWDKLVCLTTWNFDLSNLILYPALKKKKKAGMELII